MKSLLFLLILMPLLLAADPENRIDAQNKLYPALPNKQGGYLTGEYLYWLAQEGGLAYATRLSQNATTGENKGKVLNLDFPWNSGFRVGAGYRMPHDHWELTTDWTQFYTTTDAQQITFTDYLYPQWATNVAPVAPDHLVTYMDARWDLKLNLIDGEIARAFQATEFLTLRPHFGVRGAWINQAYKTNLTGGQDNSITIYADNLKITHDFRGVGFRAALDTEWEIWQHISIYANLGGSLLYGRFTIRRVEEQSTSEHLALSTAIDILDEYHQIVPTADIALGLSWDHTFSKTIAIRLRAGWEFNDFFSQNQFEHLQESENSTYSFIANQNDLTMQGLTLSARLDF